MADWMIWWPVGLMAALMLADVAAAVVSAVLQRRIVACRAEVLGMIEDEELRHQGRLREIRAVIAQCDDARAKCDRAKAAMDEAAPAFERMFERAAGARGVSGGVEAHPRPLPLAGGENVVRLPVLKLADVVAGAASSSAAEIGD
jgi:hypothetical protein